MLWGRRSEKRSDPNHPTLFDLQLTADELAAERQRIVAAEMQLDAASQQQALDDLLTRRKRKKLERLGRGGREQFPAHLERRESVLDLSDEAKQGLVLLRVDVIERLRFEKPQVYVEVIHRHIYVNSGDPDAGVMAPPAPVAIQPGVK